MAKVAPLTQSCVFCRRSILSCTCISPLLREAAVKAQVYTDPTAHNANHRRILLEPSVEQAKQCYTCGHQHSRLMKCAVCGCEEYKPIKPPFLRQCLLCGHRHSQKGCGDCACKPGVFPDPLSTKEETRQLYKEEARKADSRANRSRTTLEPRWEKVRRRSARRESRPGWYKKMKAEERREREADA